MQAPYWQPAHAPVPVLAVREITSLVPQRLKGLPEAEYVARRTELEAMALDVARTRSVPEVRRAIQRAASCSRGSLQYCPPN